MTPAKRDGPTVHVRGARRWGVRSAAIKRAALATLAQAVPRVRGEVTVVLSGDREIRRLNREYRGKDRSTDVLSFDIGDGLAAGEPFGDIVISVETAKRQAKDYGAPLETEILRLLIHGTLHLCGYDHHERRDAARMHGLTRRLLQRVNET
jgi:rRNA maturation RNase YbeY